MGVGKGVAYWSLNGYWIQHRISSEHWKCDLHLTMIQILKLTLVVRNMFTKRTFKTLVCFCFAVSSPSCVLVTTSASTGFNGKNRLTTGSSASLFVQVPQKLLKERKVSDLQGVGTNVVTGRWEVGSAASIGCVKWWGLVMDVCVRFYFFEGWRAAFLFGDCKKEAKW